MPAFKAGEVRRIFNAICRDLNISPCSSFFVSVNKKIENRTKLHTYFSFATDTATKISLIRNKLKLLLSHVSLPQHILVPISAISCQQ